MSYRTGYVSHAPRQQTEAGGATETGDGGRSRGREQSSLIHHARGNTTGFVAARKSHTDRRGTALVSPDMPGKRLLFCLKNILQDPRDGHHAARGRRAARPRRAGASQRSPSSWRWGTPFSTAPGRTCGAGCGGCRHGPRGNSESVLGSTSFPKRPLLSKLLSSAPLAAQPIY